MEKQTMTTVEVATKHVDGMPPAISGSGGHRATFAVAAALIHGFALTDEEAWPILEAYNARCKPQWSERELRHKLASAHKICRHSQPRGYLRAPLPAKPAKPAKPLLLRVVDWRDRVAEVRRKHVPVTTSDCGMDQPSAPSPMDRERFIAAAIRIFKAELLPERGDDTDDPGHLSHVLEPCEENRVKRQETMCLWPES